MLLDKVNSTTPNIFLGFYFFIFEMKHRVLNGHDKKAQKYNNQKTAKLVSLTISSSRYLLSQYLELYPKHNQSNLVNIYWFGVVTFVRLSQ